MKKIIYKKIILICAFVFPLITNASEVRLETSRADLAQGDEFTVTAIMHSQESINAIEGEIIFDNEILEIKEIRDGNSSINFWIEKPYVKSNNKIFFSGITPGGLEGVNNKLLSVVFVAKKTGKTILFPNNIVALQNDGLGTPITMDISDVEVLVRSGDANTYIEYLADTVQPEYFNPIIAKDTGLFDDKYFVSFATQDKDSGISHYEIKEYTFRILSLFTPWKKVQSPYVLSDQRLTSYVEIKAVDNNKNFRVVKVLPQNKVAAHVY